MEIVYQHAGKIVPGIACCNGNRYSTSGTKKRGGYHPKVKMLNSTRWTHPLGKIAISD